MRILIILVSSAITILNAYEIGIELTVVLSVSITAITSIEALFGWGKKSTKSMNTIVMQKCYELKLKCN